MQTFKSKADRLGIDTGVSGEVSRGVVISDKNRVSGFVKGTDVPGVENLLKTRHNNYSKLRVPAVVFGLHQPDGSINYALYANYNPEG